MKDGKMKNLLLRGAFVIVGLLLPLASHAINLDSLTRVEAKEMGRLPKQAASLQVGLNTSEETSVGYELDYQWYPLDYVGLGIGLGYLVLQQFQGIFQQRNQGGDKKVLGMWGVALGVLIPIAVFYYNTSEQFHELMRFGFEGFFSLAETGEWMVASNETLESMIVFPEDLETWIVGDGYFANQRNDINYLGDATEGGFYMGTDIGYLRFIFYFGLIGLFAMSMVIIYAASLCAESYPEYRAIFWLVCLANFVVWLKVSTDLFLFFCPFICASIIANAFEQEEEDEDEEEAPDIQEA